MSLFYVNAEKRIKTYKVKLLSLLQYIEALSFYGIAMCFLHITNANACSVINRGVFRTQ